jgi:hypothetical protein
MTGTHQRETKKSTKETMNDKATSNIQEFEDLYEILENNKNLMK